MRKAIIIITVALVFLVIIYGVSVLLCGLGLWALCTLGVITAWTWKQAFLWAIVIEVAIAFLRTIFSSKNNN